MVTCGKKNWTQARSNPSLNWINAQQRLEYFSRIHADDDRPNEQGEDVQLTSIDHSCIAID